MKLWPYYIQLATLAQRSGMIGFAFMTRGYIHDTAVPVQVESGGALDFI